jgi:hypothetical protein
VSFENLIAGVAAERATKIRKLLILSKDSGATEGESQAAALMAQKLMLKYDLSENEVMAQDVSDEARSFMRKKEAYTKPATEYMRILLWHERLAVIIAENFRCHTYFQWWKGNRNENKGASTRRIVFLGLREDTDLAVEVFEFIWKAIEYCAEDYLEDRPDVKGREKQGVRNDYIFGYLNGLNDKFKAQVEENGYQLVLVKDALVEAEFGKLKLSTSKTSATRSGDKDAWQSGYTKGREFEAQAKRLN